MYCPVNGVNQKIKDHNMITENPSFWHRLESSGQNIYVNSEKPDWLVVGRKADILLKHMLEHPGAPEKAACASADGLNASLSRNLISIAELQSHLSTSPAAPYTGRAPLLSTDSLKECWFHLTNNCNLACKHCLFSASPAATESLPADRFTRAVDEARKLGCRLFYFTGGEPLTYPGFVAYLAEILTDPDTHAVILTNGMLIEKNLAGLKKLPVDRLHLQISMDGLREQHDAQRGAGSFDNLVGNLQLLKENDIPATIAVAVNRTNIDILPEMVVFAADQGISNLHFMWHFVRGKGSAEQFVPPSEILPRLIAAQEIAEKKGVLIDNIETLRSQVFSTPGTRFDLSNSGWESLAIGPDGTVFPSPALVDVDDLRCGHIADGLAQCWRHSAVLERIRAASLLDSPKYAGNPLKFITGGGDIDHSYLAGGDLVGHDPYTELYDGLVLWLIARQVRTYGSADQSGILLRMGDVRHDCPDGGRGVCLTHCNCVISLSDDLGHSSVREFYRNAAVATNEDIVNPFASDQASADFIPDESKKRSYGCGSPVRDADITKDEVVVDLGSGSGVECFIAAAETGPGGRVYGIDMTDEMLELARNSKTQVTARLGYDNVEFRKGFLEDLPLEDNTADVVISNCVINLSPDKRKTFLEVLRILKPGGRMIVSDIVTDAPIPVEIKNNEIFRGECLGGAMQQDHLMSMLHFMGFEGTSLIKRFPYRREGDTSFYSLTFSCYKPEQAREVEVIYRGPFKAVYTEDGVILVKGRRTKISSSALASLDDSVYILDGQGAVVNLHMENSCCPAGPAAEPNLIPLHFLDPGLAGGCCGSGPKSAEEKSRKIISLAEAGTNSKIRNAPSTRHQTGCMVCGEELHYLHYDKEVVCHYCGARKRANILCRDNHFICDDCHQQDGLQVIKLICTDTGEDDLITLLDTIRRHPAMPLHGPEHHALVPGVILTAYRNRGGKLSKEQILTGIERGSKVPGGVCGFWGNCGAAAGVGIAFSILLDATPLTAGPRHTIQKITARVLDRIADTTGPRCCRRESITALQEAARISREFLPVTLRAEADITCRQWEANRECIRKQCPFWQAANSDTCC